LSEYPSAPIRAVLPPSDRATDQLVELRLVGSGAQEGTMLTPQARVCSRGRPSKRLRTYDDGKCYISSYRFTSV